LGNHFYEETSEIFNKTHIENQVFNKKMYLLSPLDCHIVGLGGAFLETTLFHQRVVGLNPALAAKLGKSFTYRFL